MRSKAPPLLTAAATRRIVASHLQQDGTRGLAMATGRRLRIGALILVGATNCGAGATRTVQGATFALSDLDDEVAAQWEAADPRTAGVSARCAYWSERRQYAASGRVSRDAPRVVVVGRPGMLHDWARAKER